MRNYLFLIFIGLSTTLISQNSHKDTIDAMLVSWYKAAADTVFIGTDATENWQNSEFRAFSKPYFDKGKAWTFTTLERTIYLDT